MPLKVNITALLLILMFVFSCQLALTQTSKAALEQSIPKGAKVFIAPVEGGFETYLAAGLQKKQVPVVIVASREKAEYEMSGVAESEKAGWAKMLFLGSGASKEQAGIKVMNIQTEEVVFAYAVHKSNSARGKQSAAEACAKHLKEKIEKGE
jgi:hypothetical protein